jgi:hypothetical protein
VLAAEEDGACGERDDCRQGKTSQAMVWGFRQKDRQVSRGEESDCNESACFHGEAGDGFALPDNA